MCGNLVEQLNPVIPHRNAVNDRSAWFWVCVRCGGVISDRVKNVAVDRRPLLSEPRPIWVHSRVGCDEWPFDDEPPDPL